MIYYAYPRWHKVSFTIIAQHHTRELRRYYRVYEIDELGLRHLHPYTKPLLIVHPLFGAFTRLGKRVEWLMSKVRKIIGVDVADSDAISQLAVSMTNYCDAVVVPSTWARESYIRSGVNVPVHVVHHGVTDAFLEPSKPVAHFHDILAMKEKMGLKLLLHYCWHSDYRKGMDLVTEVYRRIRKERRDVILVSKVGGGLSSYHKELKDLGCIVISGWLKEDQQIELYDLCDIYLGFSRGGGFELNNLEALIRGEIVIAPDK